MEPVGSVDTSAPSTSQEGARGVLWTYTVQRFAPKSPPYVAPEAGFTPFVVGYVEIGERRIEGVIDVDPADAWIGMQLELVSSTGVPHFRAVPV
jgi:uncharacterized OB-fold protein